MSDHEADFRRAYETLVDQMPHPPSYERITARALTPAAGARATWPTAVVATVLVLVLTGGVALLLREGGSPAADDSDIVTVTTGADTRLQPEPPTSQSVFSEATGAVLVFDDGLAGIISLDLDDGRVERRPLDGQRAGDPVHRLLRVGNSLVVGWGEIHVLPIDTLEGGLLGRATIFIPAVEPDTVWLIDHSDGRIGPIQPTYRQVGLDGGEIVSAAGLDQEAAHGIPGGVVHETESGIILWYPDAEDVRISGSGPGFVADVVDGLIAWCEGECILHLTQIGGRDIVVPSPDPTRTFESRSARFSPDGLLLAAIIAEPAPIGPDSSSAVAVVDVPSGEVILVTEPLLPRPGVLAWSPDGRHLFFSSYSYGGTETLVGWYRPADGHTEVVTVPFGGALSFVVLERGEADAFFPVDPPATDGPPSAFVPATRVEGDRIVLPLTFPDGSRAELRYPSGLDLVSHGLAPYSSGRLPGAARDFNVYHGPVEDVLGRYTIERLGEYPNADGQAVGFYHLAAYGAEVDHLVFGFDAWTVLVYDYTGAFDGGAATMTDEQRATWARAFHGRADEDGFLILSADPPLRLAAAGDHAGPQLSFRGESGGLSLSVGPCEPYEDPQADPLSGSFSWCEPGAQMRVHAQGDADFIQTMLDELEIRRR